MNRFLRNIAEKFKRWPMQKKMFCSFALPTILIILTANAIAFPMVSESYKKQLKNMVSQTNDQAQDFIMNYAENMDYISQLITHNWDIKATLSSANFGNYENGSDVYREFCDLNSEFESIELSNDIYRIGLYLPDEFSYSNNNYYFYPESELEARSDYSVLMKTIQENQYYFAAITEKESSNPKLSDNYFALFQPLRITTKTGKERLYVVKVEVLLDNLKQVLFNASSAMSSYTYLTDASGDLICSTDDSFCKNLKETAVSPAWMSSDWTKITVDKADYFVFSRQINRYKWQMFSLIPANEFFHQAEFIWVLAVILLICLAAAVAAISFFLSRYYAGRLSVINQKMKSLEKGDLGDRFILKSNSGDEIDEIYTNFNCMTEQLHCLMEERFQLGKKVASANLKALQAQINPHFLYNTLDLINWGAMDYGATQISDIARNLGQFYRLSLNHGKMAISIENELRHVEAYVNIENFHFGGAIKLVIEVPEDIRQFACLNIILQPFVENAIVHGIAEHPEIKKCSISIAAKQEEKDLIFSVHDDGLGMNEKQLAEILKEDSSSTYNGYGVKNINLRIHLCYGDGYGVSYKSIPAEGTTAYIRIPALTLDELNKTLK